MARPLVPNMRLRIVLRCREQWAVGICLELAERSINGLLVSIRKPKNISGPRLLSNRLRLLGCRLQSTDLQAPSKCLGTPLLPRFLSSEMGCRSLEREKGGHGVSQLAIAGCPCDLGH